MKKKLGLLAGLLALLILAGSGGVSVWEEVSPPPTQE